MIDRAMSVSDEQIEAMMTEAGEAGDELQVALCLVALERTDDERVQEQRRGLERMGVIPEHVGAEVRARGLCAVAKKQKQNT